MLWCASDPACRSIATAKRAAVEGGEHPGRRYARDAVPASRTGSRFRRPAPNRRHGPPPDVRFVGMPRECRFPSRSASARPVPAARKASLASVAPIAVEPPPALLRCASAPVGAPLSWARCNRSRGPVRPIPRRGTRHAQDSSLPVRLPTGGDSEEQRELCARVADAASLSRPTPP